MDKNSRNLWVDYLRATITVLVIAHHSSLAYTTFASFNTEAYINSTNPVVDSRRWIGLDIFQNFNDAFFMFLMFLIGGLFLSGSINKKGAYIFAKDRFYRLFVPFLVLGTVLMLISYFPAYYLAYGNTNIVEYTVDFFTKQKWPVGPPWFIWVLFLFNLLFALFYSQYRWLLEKSGNMINSLKNKPLRFFTIIFLMTWLLYVPLAYHVGAGTWTGFGPFDFQLSRILSYFGYFSLGIMIGNVDFSNGIFSKRSEIVKKWKLWIVYALLIYAVLTLIPDILNKMMDKGSIKEFNAWMVYFFIYTASCTLSCIAFISVFRKWAFKEISWMSSLSKNAYLIYLLHYPFVVWSQFLLLNFDIPAFIKFMITLGVSLSLSWFTSTKLRKIQIIDQYL